MTGKRKKPSGLTPDSTRALLAKCLHDWRKSRGLLLKQAAADFGVSEATWDRWETGKRFPVPENLRRLAEFIGAPMCGFFYPEGESCPACPLPDGNRKKP